MSLYIKEWPDNTATLMTHSGRVIWTFASVEDAVEDGHEIVERRKARRDEHRGLTQPRAKQRSY
ncbi:MAG TPA: hypothetical protein VGA00_12345 [Acidiferrobacterales bacterium]